MVGFALHDAFEGQAMDFHPTAPPTAAFRHPGGVPAGGDASTARRPCAAGCDQALTKIPGSPRWPGVAALR